MINGKKLNVKFVLNQLNAGNTGALRNIVLSLGSCQMEFFEEIGGMSELATGFQLCVQHALFADLLGKRHPAPNEHFHKAISSC